MSIAKKMAAKLFGHDPVFARRTAGGIQAPTHKEHSLRSRIMATPIPPRLLVPAGQQNANDSRTVSLLVKPGDRVKKYQKLAVMRGTGEESCDLPVHAPSSGEIGAIEYSAVADHGEKQQLCILLVSDGHDEALPLSPAKNYAELPASDITALICEAGIAGMGGAGFPTAEKLNSCKNSTIEFLIINAAECEPYISADEALLRERADKVIHGSNILAQASKAKRCIVAIEDSKLDAIAALRLALQNEAHTEQTCELLLIPSKYPAGSERQLIQSVTGIELAADQLPTAHGVIVHNVGTAYASYEAIVEGKPCISRIITLCGQALQTPKNFEALIGTPASYLFQLCGIDPESRQQTILGGTLMGNELTEEHAAICKTSNCLIAASAEELQLPEAELACIRCGFCADACPSKLLPQQLLALSRSEGSTALLDHGLFDCIECGVCDYVCPSHIPLVSTFKASKKAALNRKQNLERSEHWQQRFQFRQYRIKKEKDQALSRKPTAAAQATKSAAQAVEGKRSDSISREQASRDIAAAVARVKARREEQNR